MELLDSARNADLLYALYGLLMFLPQCQAFHCLKDRLACLPPENVVKLNRYLRKAKCHKCNINQLIKEGNIRMSGMDCFYRISPCLLSTVLLCYYYCPL